MKRPGTVMAAVVVAASLLVQGIAQGAPAAKKTATIPIPSDGNAAVAHLVLRATPKKGKKPKRPAKRPKLKVLKAPKGVAIAAASFKRDAKLKNRWHATVAVTNPVAKKLGRAVASASDPGDDGVIVLTVIETDTEYIVVVELVQIEQDITYVDSPPAPWASMHCDPTGSLWYTALLGPVPGPLPPFVDGLCDLGSDMFVPPEFFEDADLRGLVFDLDPFPGNPNEFFLRFEGVNVEPFRAAAFQFPGHNVTAQLPPPGYAGVVTPNTITWGNKNQPFMPGQEYRGNVRFNTPLEEDELYRGLFAPTGSPPYSMPFAGHFSP